MYRDETSPHITCSCHPSSSPWGSLWRESISLHCSYRFKYNNTVMRSSLNSHFSRVKRLNSFSLSSQGSFSSPLHHLHGPSLDPLQSVHIFFELWGLKLDQIQSYKCWVGWDDHICISASNGSADPAQIQFALYAAVAHCWFLFRLLSTGTPYSIQQGCSPATQTLYWAGVCTGPSVCVVSGHFHCLRLTSLISLCFFLSHKLKLMCSAEIACFMLSLNEKPKDLTWLRVCLPWQFSLDQKCISEVIFWIFLNYCTEVHITEWVWSMWTGSFLDKTDPSNKL